MIQLVSKEYLDQMKTEQQNEPLLVMEYGGSYIVCTMDEYRYMTTDIENYLQQPLA